MFQTGKHLTVENAIAQCNAFVGARGLAGKKTVARVDDAKAFAVRFELRTALERLEKGFVSGDDAVRELILASFLENLPRPDEPGSEVRDMLGPELGAQLRRTT